MRPFIHTVLSSSRPYALIEPVEEAEALGIPGAARDGGTLRVELGDEGGEMLRGSALQEHLEKALRNLRSETRPVRASGLSLDLSRPLTMGVLNVTPDSFSDGGEHFSAKKAIDRGLEMAEEGADIIDVGGESTRPCSHYVDARTESARVLPVIEALAASLDIPVSVDTRKPAVAEKAIDAGARMVNDVSGLREEGMMRLVADTGVAAVMMHMRGTPRTMQDDLSYNDVVHEVMRYLHRQREELLDAGASLGQVILDPGIRFGKSPQQNLEIVRRLQEFRCLGSPLLVGASRKSFIGKVLGAETEQRLEGSLAVASVAVANGADVIRAHDVAETVKAVAMAAALRPVRERS